MSGQPTSNEEGARGTIGQSQGESQGGDTIPAEPKAQQENYLEAEKSAQESSTLGMTETAVEAFARTLAVPELPNTWEILEQQQSSSPPPPESHQSGEGDDEESLIDYNEVDLGLEEDSQREPLSNPGVPAGNLETELQQDTNQRGPSPPEEGEVHSPLENPAAVAQNAPAAGNVPTTVFASELAKLNRNERLSLGFNPQGELSDKDLQTLRDLRVQHQIEGAFSPEWNPDVPTCTSDFFLDKMHNRETPCYLFHKVNEEFVMMRPKDMLPIIRASDLFLSLLAPNNDGGHPWEAAAK